VAGDMMPRFIAKSSEESSRSTPSYSSEISAVFGGHVLRHSHASRQVDQRTPARILSSILGHRDWESTSTYTRVAVERLRGLALPVPR